MSGLRHFIRFVLAICSGTLAVFVILWLSYRFGGDPEAPPIELRGGDLQVVSGSGRQTDAGLEVSASDQSGVVVIQGAVRPFDTVRYARLSWQLDGLSEAQELRVLWASAASRAQPPNRLLSEQERKDGVVDLTDETAWDGRVIAIGLVVVGHLTEPLTLNRLDILPKAPTQGQILQAIWRDWTGDEGWTGHSINFEYAGPGRTSFSPTLQVAVWVAISGLLYLIMCPPWRGHRNATPYVAIGLLGWLILDVGWQWTLVQRIDQTQRLYAGLDMIERQEAGPDRDFYPFLQEIKRHLQPGSGRLFILSSEPTGYAAGRARYHLLPVNTFLTETIDSGTSLHTGDYVLTMMPMSTVRYDRSENVLVIDGYRLPATLELSNPSLGGLFRILGES